MIKGEPLTILLVEDEVTHIDAIQRAFEHSERKTEIWQAGSLREYRELMAGRLPDVVMLDLFLPDGRATEVLVSPPENAPCPMLVITSLGDEQMAVAAIKAGALDYIVKSPESFANMPHLVERAMREWALLQQRKRSEAQLRLEDAALAAAANAILITDCAGVIRQVNPAFTTLTGYTAAEAIGRNPRELFKSGQHEAAFYRNLWETVLAGQVWRGEIVNRRKDGSHYLDEQTITPVRDERGKIAYFISIRQDITEKKKMEEHLRHAQRMESVGHLASGLAHDLNNILAPILMAAPILREALRAPSALKMLDIVEANAHRGADVIKQLLIFGRGTDSRRVPLQLRTLVRDMESLIEETFPKNIRCRSDLLPEPWLINGDITQMHQMLMNLCVNARDAMPTGGTLSMTLENVMVDPTSAGETPGVAPGPCVVLSVTDTGAGIAAENLNRIFDPFFTTKAVGDGSGLGLSTVMGIVKSHHGAIHVKSQVGRGTQFKVYLPAHLDGVAPPVAPAKGSPAPPGRGELVLVVDDEESIRRTMRQALENNGYTVTVAGDGAAGLARFTQYGREVRVVITDLVMPFMDGPTFIRELRRLNPQALVIAVSGRQMERDLSVELGAEVQAFLPKPFGAEQLLETLHQVLHPPAIGPGELPRTGG